MFIGIDLGTSSVKMILIDYKQKIIATSNSSLSVQSPKDGYNEQNPQEWVDATIECFRSYLKIKNLGNFLKQFRLVFQVICMEQHLLMKMVMLLDHVFLE